MSLKSEEGNVSRNAIKFTLHVRTSSSTITMAHNRWKLSALKRWIKSLFSLWTFLSVESPNRVSLLISMCVGLLSLEYLHCLPKRDTRTKLWHVVWYYFFVQCRTHIHHSRRWVLWSMQTWKYVLGDIKWQRHARVWAFRKPKFMPEEV